MVKITRENFKRIYSEKIIEHSKELEEYDGELPIIFYEYISIRNRREYLESIGKFYEYAKFMKQAWKEYHAMPAIPQPVDSKPHSPCSTRCGIGAS